MNQELLKTISRQKQKKDAFLFTNFVPRTQLDWKDELLKPNLIKIITGPRRAGKSIFLFLLLKGIDFMYANFDDEELLKNIDNKDDFTDALQKVYGPIKTILFDEIQNLPTWDLYLNKLQRTGFNVYITGSNSNLLSTEFASSLTGRYRSVEILPFSFKEYLKAKDIKKEEDLTIPFQNILGRGGFPELVLSTLDSEAYMENLISAVLYKDVTRRYKIREPKKIELMLSYLISNTCNNLNYSKLTKICEMKDPRTTKKYIGYIEDSYLFYFLHGFSFKVASYLSSSKKIYTVDNGILSYKNLFNSPSNGVFFENLVFTELVKKGFKPNANLFYYKTKTNNEVDFILKDIFHVFQIIQVCYDISNKKTEEREIRSLLQASQELKCDNLLVITKDIDKAEKIDGKVIDFISFAKWSLADNGIWDIIANNSKE